MSAQGQAATGAPLCNAMTVDVEDYFQVSAFEANVDKSEWQTLPRRVEDNTLRILDLFAQHHVKTKMRLL